MIISNVEKGSTFIKGVIKQKIFYYHYGIHFLFIRFFFLFVGKKEFQKWINEVTYFLTGKEKKTVKILAPEFDPLCASMVGAIRPLCRSIMDSSFFFSCCLTPLSLEDRFSSPSCWWPAIFSSIMSSHCFVCSLSRSRHSDWGGNISS